MRKRPFLLLATEFLLGIVCVREQLPAWGVLAVLLLVYTTPWKERGMRKVLFAAGLPGMFLLGMLQMQRQIDFRQQYLQKLTDGQEVRLAGKIDRIEPKTRCVYYYLKDCTVEAESQTLPCNDVIAYVSSASHSAGQILNIEGTISLFTEASNEGMFDARQFYQSQKIDFGIWVTKISRVYGKPDRYRCALQNMKKRANDVIRYSIRDDGVLSAMLLGEKGDLDAEIKSLYQRAGIAHVLAISGLHISLLGMGLYRLLRKRLHTRYVTAALATTVFLISYAVLSGNGVSTQRAVGMCLIYLFADVTGYAYDMLNALGIVVLVLLWENPFLLSYSGFVFSVMAVIAIGVGANVLLEWEHSWKRRQQAGEETIKKTFFSRQKEGILVSFAIQLFTIPLVAYSYYEIPVYAMLINLFVLAVVNGLLGLTVLGVIVGMAFLPAGRVLFAPCGWMLDSYRFLCEVSLKIPGAQRITGKPAHMRIFWYYLGLGVFLLAIYACARRNEKHKDCRETADLCVSRRKKRLQGIVFSCFIAFLLLFLLFPQKKSFEIDFLDVGQGDGIYLCTGGGTSMFIDGGSTDVKQVGKYRILPFLKAKGVSEISYWFVSHTDTDHVSGLKEVLVSGYRVEYLVFAKAVEKEAKTKELAELARSHGTKVFYMQAGDTVRSKRAAMRCLYPKAADKAEDINDRCLVLQFEEGDISALFGGDISTDVEEQLIRRRKWDKVLVFKADHHGSRYANAEALLKCIRPEITVASAGKDNRYGHPSPDAVQRIKESGSRFFCTIEGGRIRVRVIENKLVCETYVK